MINLSLEYRTRSGLRTRGLNYSYRAQRVFIFGNTHKTGMNERVIIGQIRNGNEWKSATWKEDGQHDYNNDLDLVEFKTPEVNTPKLFA